MNDEVKCREKGCRLTVRKNKILKTAKQSVFLRIHVRASSQTKGLERGWKQRARLGRDAKNTVFFLSPHTPYGRVRLARFARVRLLRHALPISLLILRKKTTVLQSKDSQVFFFCKRTNNIHKFEVCFLRGEVTSNGFKIFNDCIVEPWILLVRLQKNLRIFCFQKTLWLDNLLPSVLVWASAL